MIYDNFIKSNLFNRLQLERMSPVNHLLHSLVYASTEQYGFESFIYCFGSIVDIFKGNDLAKMIIKLLIFPMKIMDDFLV